MCFYLFSEVGASETKGSSDSGVGDPVKADDQVKNDSEANTVGTNSSTENPLPFEDEDLNTEIEQKKPLSPEEAELQKNKIDQQVKALDFLLEDDQKKIFLDETDLDALKKDLEGIYADIDLGSYDKVQAGIVTRGDASKKVKTALIDGGNEISEEQKNKLKNELDKLSLGEVVDIVINKEKLEADLEKFSLLYLDEVAAGTEANNAGGGSQSETGGDSSTISPAEIKRIETKLEKYSPRVLEVLADINKGNDLGLFIRFLLTRSVDGSSAGLQRGGGNTYEDGTNVKKNADNLEHEVKKSNTEAVTAIYYAYHTDKIDSRGLEFSKAMEDGDKEAFNNLKKEFLKLVDDQDKWPRLQKGLSTYLSSGKDSEWKFDKEKVKKIFSDLDFKEKNSKK